jgi:signal peptidase I
MLPNLLVGDYLFVNKFAYGYSKYSLPFAPDLFEGRIFDAEPKRGDVVVFRVVDDGDKDYIKRIVGLPGDKIRFVNGSVVVNGKSMSLGKIGTYGTDTIDPETVGADMITENLNGRKYNILDVYDAPYDNTGEYIVPKGHYFFAGDNRDNSQDSRFLNGPVGFIPKDRIIGRAEWIFFSIKDSSFLEFWNWFDAIRFERIFKSIE